jgi:hypothetical protein
MNDFTPLHLGPQRVSIVEVTNHSGWRETTITALGWALNPLACPILFVLARVFGGNARIPGPGDYK